MRFKPITSLHRLWTRFRRSLPFYTQILLCLLLLTHQVSSECLVELCAARFTSDLERDKVLVSRNIRYCLLITSYNECLSKTAKPCRGQIKFHSLVTLLRQQLKQYDCPKLIEDFGRAPSDIGQLSYAHGSSDHCVYPFEHQRGAAGYRVCQLFGDPHLRTFDGQHETCRVNGAWPLIDNAYFAIQITNAPANTALSSATYVSKITVLIKQLSGCTSQKRYDASGDDATLSSTFDDGSRFSGRSLNTAALEMHQDTYTTGDSDVGSSRVELRLKYISTRIIIRRHGRHLSVTIKMPEQIISEKSSLETSPLCVTGCPSRETLPFKEALANPSAFVACYGQDKGRHRTSKLPYQRDEAVRLCANAKLTDFYFDACVFDVMLSGDLALRAAAASALTDMHVLYAPYRRHYEMNRTDLSIYDHLRPDCPNLAVADQGVVTKLEMSSTSASRSSMLCRLDVTTFVVVILYRLIVLA